MKTSESTAKLAKALATCQQGFPDIPKDQVANAGTYSYKYADLASIIKVTSKVLAKNGLSVAQAPSINGEGLLLVSRLLHESGEWIEGQLPLPSGVTAQQMGSAITYARRYSLCALLGICPDEDDDGAAASPATRQEPSQGARGAPRKATPAKKKPVEATIWTVAIASVEQHPKDNGAWIVEDTGGQKFLAFIPEVREGARKAAGSGLEARLHTHENNLGGHVIDRLELLEG